MILPTVDRVRRQVIIDDSITASIAIQPLSTSSLSHRVERNSILSEEELREKSMLPQYRALVTLDGEREHVKVLKKLFTHM